ncbi:hypothetical protein [Lentzea guizhouensis]|uniref:hypothetical protein n=1 Tax=Lentzea guizhouensis TaxID=1586287 RepID=UPI0008FF1AB8|nr:hypothetical protein [Lentzea guizhouensis]
MRLHQIAAVAGAVLLTTLVAPADAHAARIACGGAVSTQSIGVRGCISAERHEFTEIPYREITAHAVITNARTRASYVDYEAFFRVREGGSWIRLGGGRTIVRGKSTIGPIEIGDTERICAPVNVTAEIRVHVKPAGGSWSNWSGAMTRQCQT